MKVFWWRGVPNFGDVLARDLAEALLLEPVEWAPAVQADLVVTGSIATMLPDGWAGTVLGIGWARSVSLSLEVSPGRLRNARVLALRGLLSLNQLGDPAPGVPREPRMPLGDPGLLASTLIRPQPKRFPMGVLPHWQDRSLSSAKGHLIDPRDPPAEVIRQIAQCDRLISSSLHGIIVADALGIERKWHPFAKVQGNGFKFADYGTVVGRVLAETWQLVDPARVAATQEGLLKAFGEYSV